MPGTNGHEVVDEYPWRDEVVEPSPDARRMMEDYDWAMRDSDINRTYAGRIVAVFDRRVFGAGVTRDASLNDALLHPECPPKAGQRMAFVPISGTCPVYSKER